VIVRPAPDRLIPPAMQEGKQPFWVRLQLLARLTLNAGKHRQRASSSLAIDWCSRNRALGWGRKWEDAES
jgi:hypothetical protein